MIVHVDGDAFFASCEVAQNERLRGKPVAVGEERGIATAISYEAKARGVSRGMLMGDIRKICPDIIIIPSHYRLYEVYARRMYNIVRRFSPTVEEYSIDECFADLSDSDSKMPHEDIARTIQKALFSDLGMTFSVGLAPTKTLAKVASKINKPAGFAAIYPGKIPEFLEKVQIGKVWGIGPSTSAALVKKGVRTALELVLKPEWWVMENFSKPLLEIWHELNGRVIHPVNFLPNEELKSVMKTGTFHPPTKNIDYLLSELIKNTERACRRLRKFKLSAGTVSFFLKTQQFMYKSFDIKFFHKTSDPITVFKEISKNINEVYNPRSLYRATGVVFRDLSPTQTVQNDLFGNSEKISSRAEMYKIVDDLAEKFGSRTIFLARSMLARRHESDDYEKRHRGRLRTSFSGFNIPFWGNAL